MPMDRETLLRYIAEAHLPVVTARKTGVVRYEIVEAETPVDSWCVAADGSPLLELSATAMPGDVILTKCGRDGLPVIDRNGHTNRWIVKRAYFDAKYRAGSLGGVPVAFPTGRDQTFAVTDRDLVIDLDGRPMALPKGSFLNITDPGAVYGVNPHDFAETYEIVEEA